MKSLMLLVWLLVVVLAAGCGASVKAPVLADGRRVAVQVVFDRGIHEQMDEATMAERNELGEWMEQELLRILTEGGYETALVADAAEFEPGGGRYLASVRVKSYVSANKSSRMEAGLGAGVVSIDAQLELLQKEGKALLTGGYGTSTGRDWKFCAGEVTEKIATAISDRLNELH